MRPQSIRTERGPVFALDAPDLLKRARYELSRHNPVTLRVSGSAMRPSLEDGDLVRIEPVNSHAVHAGDIILYQSLRDTALIHRVVRLEQRPSGRFIVTRGDASVSLDVPVPIHHVMGRVTTIDRNGEQIEIPGKATGFVAWLMRLWDRLRGKG